MHRPSFRYRGLIMAFLAATGLASTTVSSLPAMAALPEKPKKSSAAQGTVVRNALPTQQMIDDEAVKERLRSAGHEKPRSCYMRKRLINRKLIRGIGRVLKAGR